MGRNLLKSTHIWLHGKYRCRIRWIGFFSKGNHPPLPKSDLNIKESNDFIWYPYDQELKKYQNIFMNGGEGWQAHVQCRSLFIKEFPKINPEDAAPGGKNVEKYVNSDNTYVELENEGPYTELQA